MRSRWLFTVLPVVFGLSLMGCENPSAGETVADDDEEEQATGQAALESPPAAKPDKKRDAQDPQKGSRRMHDKRGPGMRHHGPPSLLQAALFELDLDDARKQVIQGELDALESAHPKMSDNAAARKALADAVRKGVTNESQLESLLQAAHPRPADNPDARDRKAASLQKLHDILSATERKQLVEAVTAKHSKADRDKDANDDDDNAEPRHGAKRDRGGFGAMFFHDVDLTDDQKAAIDQIMKDARPAKQDKQARRAEHDAKKQERAAKLQAFVAESFDAKAFTDGMQGDAMKPGDGPDPDHMAKVAAKIMPILTAEQRAQIADRIEAGPEAMKPHRQPGRGQRRQQSL